MVTRSELVPLVDTYLNKLCGEIGDRSVGSEGNRRATQFFEEEVSKSGWSTQSSAFDALDWHPGVATIALDGREFIAHPSPYSLGCSAEGLLVAISSIDELEALETAQISGTIVLLYGEIAREQLMPKNFVFYNPEEHRKIISVLESGRPEALICATGRNPALAGGLYPFPLIEDGDFDIPSVYTTEEIGIELSGSSRKRVQVRSSSERSPGKGYNVVATKGDSETKKRVVVTAHIDAKKGTPGAIDNATGVVILLILAKILGTYETTRAIEIVAFNGEDYYAAPGQMLYLHQNEGRFGEISLNINIDGAGYLDGDSAYSLYEVSEEMERAVHRIFDRYEHINKGVQWNQGDHSIFVYQGCPAIAISSAWFTNNIDSQQITHTPKDNVDIVDSAKVAEIATALGELIKGLEALG